MKALSRVTITILLSCIVLTACSDSIKKTTLYRFAGGTDGFLPRDLIQGSDGNFYGTTRSGGIYNHGTAFKITPQGIKTILYNFYGLWNGTGPYGLIQGSDGNFYGTTRNGGEGNPGDAVDNGIVFKITPQGKETILHRFAGGTDGVGGNGLIQGSDGNFYGTTLSGGDGACHSDNGNNGCGIVFKITPQGNYTILHSLDGRLDGTSALSLIQGTDGNFYGVTIFGGVGLGEGELGYGAVFKITPQGNYTTLYRFAGGTDGRIPSTIIQGKDGNFYGTTIGGGVASGYGTVFKITPQGIKTTLHSFVGGLDDGATVSSIIQGSDGNFYGTTIFGGDGWVIKSFENSYGTIFKITPQGQETIFYRFTGSDGVSPGSIIQASDGNFYGTTGVGGSNGGIVFKLTPN